MFSLLTAGLACLAPFAAAYTAPAGDTPEGNAILTPGLNSVVTAGQDYTVTWDPSTHGTVSFVLLKGPGSNAIPQYAIVEKIENSGSYTWAVEDDLEPSDGTSGYGLQLIDDSTGAYQYSTQFGIADAEDHGAASSSSSAWGSASGYVSATSSSSAPASASTWSSTVPSSTSFAQSSSEASSSVAEPTSLMTVSFSRYPVSNSTMTQTSHTTLATHTSTGTKTSSTQATSASASAPAATNAADNVAASLAGLVIAAAVAVLAI